MMSDQNELGPIVPLSWNHTLIIWWALSWRWALAALVISEVGAFCRIPVYVLGFLSTLCTLWALKAALSKKYNSFVVRLVARPISETHSVSSAVEHSDKA